MSTSDAIKITPEVEMTDNKVYLVRIDHVDEEGRQEAAYVDTLENVKLVIDSLAASEENRLRQNETEVFRQDLDGGKKITISTKGKWLGGMHIKTVIDFISVGEAVLIRGRHEKEPISASEQTKSSSTETKNDTYQKKIIAKINSWGKSGVALQEQDSSDSSEVSIDE